MKVGEQAYDVIVVGGGAAGIMAAGIAASRKLRVLVLEKNSTLGKKLSITGGGRCNILNAEEDERVLLSHYGAATEFLYSAFSQCGMQDARDFFASIGVPTTVEARKRAFPVSQKAPEVTKALATYMQKQGVEVQLRSPVTDIQMKDGAITCVVAGGVRYRAASYIFATGGTSHPETGSTGDGFGWLRRIGHTVADPTPTIVPLKVRDSWVHALAGRTIENMKITFFVESVRKLSLKGTVLLTHFGISGPLVLNASGTVRDLMQEGEVTARIDAFPEMDLGTLDRHIMSVFDEHKNKELQTVFRLIAPPGMGDVLLTLMPDIDAHTRVHSVTREQRRALAELLKALPLSISGHMGADHAVVADGGVSLTELDTKTMRSNVCRNLFIIGDLLNIRRPTGGYSLQLCWTTGYVAGKHA